MRIVGPDLTWKIYCTSTMAEFDDSKPSAPPNVEQPAGQANPDVVCPVCGGPLISEKCKVVCRSDRCRYRIVFNCAEF